MTHNFIIDAWQFGQQKAQPVIDINAVDSSQPVWFHCDRNHPQLRDWLKSQDIDNAIIDGLLAEDTRPRCQFFDDEQCLLIVRGVNLNEGSQPDDMLSIRMLLKGNRLYSMRRVPSKAVTGIRQQLSEGQGPGSLESLVVNIIEQLHRRIESFLDPLETFIDDIDDEQVSHQEVAQIQLTKRRLLKLNRFLKPQSHALEAFQKAGLARFKRFRGRLDNQRDGLLRILEDIDFNLAQIGMINDNLNQRSADRMNNNTYILSVIAGVFLPLGFLTGLFGINIGGMPGVDNEQAFWIFCVIMAAISAGVLFLFRRLKFV